MSKETEFNHIYQQGYRVRSGIVRHGRIGPASRRSATPKLVKKEDPKAAAGRKPKKRDKPEGRYRCGDSIRRGIEDAVYAHARVQPIVEASSAEDIGQTAGQLHCRIDRAACPAWPQRVPAAHDHHSIRGLSGDFAGTILNGRERSTVATTAPESRSIPSELLSAVVILRRRRTPRWTKALLVPLICKPCPLSFGQRRCRRPTCGEKNLWVGQCRHRAIVAARFSLSRIDQSPDKKFRLGTRLCALESLPWQR